MGSVPGKSTPINIVVVGLDNSGKTTIINRLKPIEARVIDTVPTVGFNVEKIKSNNMILTCYDMSGQGRYRNLWEHYYTNCQGVIFVVDSSDRLRLAVAKEELDQLLETNEIKNKKLPILVFANKKDSNQALSSSKCSEILELQSLERPFFIISTNALTGEGVEEGIYWLTNQIVKK